MADTDLGTARGKVEISITGALASLAALRAESAATVGTLNTVGRAGITAGAGFVGIGAAIAGGFAVAVKKTAELEKRLSFIAGITGLTKTQMEDLRQTTIKLGQTSAYTANEVADGFTELAKAGATPKQIIGGMGDAMVTLGQSSDIALSDAATAIVAISSTFDLAADKAGHVADVIQGAANASIASVEDLAVSMKYAGGVASNLGISLEDTSTALAILANAGIKGSTAGTSLRRILLQLTPRTDKAAAAMKKLGIITKDGTNRFYDAKGNAKKLSDITEILRTSTKGLTAEMKQKALATIFGDRAINAAIALSKGGSTAFDKMYKAIGNVKAADVAAERLNNLAGAWEILKGSVDSALIAVGSPAQEPLKVLVQNVTKIINAFTNLRPEIQKNIVKVLLGISALSLLSGGFLLVAGSILRAMAVMKQLKNAFAVARATTLAFTGTSSLLGAGLSLLLSPVVLVIAAIAALIAIFVLAYRSSADLRKALADAGKKIADAFGPALETVKKDFQGFLDMLKEVGKYLTGKFADFISVAADSIVALIDGLSGKSTDQGGVVGFFGKVGAAIKDVHDKYVKYFKKAFVDAKADITTFVDKVKTFWDDTADLRNFFATAVSTVWQKSLEGAKTAWEAFKTGITTGGITADTGLAGQFNGIAVAIHDNVLPRLDEMKSKLGDLFTNAGTIDTSGFTKPFIDMGNYLRDVVVPFIQTQLDKMKKSIQDFFNLPEADGITPFEKIKNGIEAALSSIQPIIDKFIKFWNDTLLPAFVDAKNTIVDELGPSLGELSKTVQNDLWPALKDLWKALKPLAQLIGGGLAIALGTFIGAVALAAAVVAEVLVGAIKILAPIIAGVINVITAILNTAVSVISGTIEIITGIIQLFAALFKGDWQGMKDAVLQILGGMFTNITALFEGLWDTAYAVVEAFVKAIVGFFQWMYDLLVGHSIVPDMVNAIVQWFQNMWDWVVEKVSGFVTAVVQFFQQLWDDVVGKVQGMIDAILGLATSLYDVGATLGGNIRDGIMDIVNGIGDLIGTAIDNAVGAISDAASTAYGKAKELGGNIWEGFKEGMGINSPSFIEKALFQLNDTTKDELKTFAGQARYLQQLGTTLPDINPTFTAPTLPTTSLQSVRDISSAKSASDTTASAIKTALAGHDVQARPLHVNVEHIDDGDSLLRRARATDNMLSMAEGGDSLQLEGLGR